MVRIRSQSRQQKWKISLMLMMLITVITDMIKNEVAVTEVTAVAFHKRMEAWPNVLVNYSLKADFRVVSEYPHLPIPGVIGMCM